MRIETHLAGEGTKRHIRAEFKGTDQHTAMSMAKAVSSGRRQRSAELTVVHSVRYPLTVEKCREMRECWGDALKVHRDLADWYRVASAERKSQVSATKKTDATLPHLSAAYPAFNAWLKADQRVTAEWIAGAYRSGGLLADEVGTGKTVGVVAGLIEAQLNGPTLIVCPKISVKAVWWKEFTAHTDIPVYACKGTRKQREKVLAEFMADPSEFKVLVIVAEMLRIKALRLKGRIEEFLGYEYPDLFNIEWSAVVVDESHRLLGSLDVVKANLAGEGLKALNYAPHRLKLAVSATPFGKGGRVEALFGTLHWLWPDEYTSRWAWLRKYFEVIEDQVFIKGGGGAKTNVFRVGGLKADVTEEAFWDELGPRMLRRTMEEVSPAHRGLKSFIEVPCELEGTQARLYKKFTEDAEVVLDGGIMSTVGVLDFMTRSRQLANGVLRMEGGRVRYTGESAKLDRLMEHLGRIDPKRKVVIASQYNEFLDAVEGRLNAEGISFYRLDGSTTDRNREAMMNAFQTSDRIKVFLLNGQAGGVSITLDAADELHALDEMYPPEANTQLFGRIFRRGRAHEVFFYLYRSMGTIDEKIGYSVGEGHAAQMRLLDGRRGLAYVREIAKYQP